MLVIRTGRNGKPVLGWRPLLSSSTHILDPLIVGASFPTPKAELHLTQLGDRLFFRKLFWRVLVERLASLRRKMP
jgi:hypothetical protein